MAGPDSSWGARSGGLCTRRGSTGAGAKPGASYINPDLGLPTVNRSVNRNSECATPDQLDRQRLSTGKKDRNVHNDACLFRSGMRFDGEASFDASGAGGITACPDPDGAGFKRAITRDRNGDGEIDLCTMTGYQSTGMPGDKEYHARVNNFNDPGVQSVDFCYDPDRNGCEDETVRDTIAVKWVRR